MISRFLLNLFLHQPTTTIIILFRSDHHHMPVDSPLLIFVIPLPLTATMTVVVAIIIIWFSHRPPHHHHPHWYPTLLHLPLVRYYHHLMTVNFRDTPSSSVKKSRPGRTKRVFSISYRMHPSPLPPHPHLCSVLDLCLL